MKTKNTRKAILLSLLLLLFLLTATFSVIYFTIPRNVSVMSYEEAEVEFSSRLVSLEIDDSELPNNPGTITSVKADAKLLGFIPAGKIDVNVFKDIKLLPGGFPFGVKISTDGILVVGVSDVDTDKGNSNPGRSAGIKCGDQIIEIDSVKASNSKQLSDAALASDGCVIHLKLKRDGKEIDTVITPAFSKSEKEWKLGLWVKDCSAGIGTVSFIDPETGAFAGLGHGICDPDTQSVIPMSSGSVYDVTITGYKPSKSGDPGELRGVLNEACGNLFGNLPQGVYGSLKTEELDTSKVLPISLKQDIKPGKATILCTVNGTEPKEYEVKISDLRKNSDTNKDMMIEVTDPELLKLTGGIVQGMSGSTIIQNGKIIGAVTHVLIDDPTRGYGIFIENMLSEMPEIYS